MTRRSSNYRQAMTILGLGLMAWLPGTSAFGGGTIGCLDGSPVVPVPQTMNGATLWPDGFQPAETFIDSRRDSSAYNGFQLLGAPSGTGNDLEFFNAIDILADGSTSYLYSAYNSGFHIWNISGNNATSPLRVAFRDGWRGDFNSFQSLPTELYFLIWDISVIDPPDSPGDTLIGLAGTEPVGFTIWDAENKGDPRQLYQNRGHQNGYSVDTENINGRSYAFVASGNGIQVYDMTRAREIGPCFEDTGVSTSCGGGNPVYRGRLGPWPWGRARYVDVLTVGNREFIASSDSFVSNPLGVEVREILDPATASSSQKLEGLNTISYGVDLFEIAGKQYLAAINFDEIEIYDLNNCLTTGTGCNFSNLEFSTETIALQDFAYLQFSESNGVPYLYQGFHTLCSRPPTLADPNFEHLLNLSGLATGGPVTEVIGESFNDPGHTTPQRRINYWSYYYDQASTGFSLVAGKHGMFNGRYFYRAAQGVLDVHDNGTVTVPTSSVSATSSDRWLSSPSVEEWVNFSGTCSNGNGTGWTWEADNAPGTPAADPNPVVQELGANLARVRGGLCGVDNYPTSTCADRTVNVAGTANCGGTVAMSPEFSVTLADPRPFFDFIDVAEGTGGLDGVFPTFPVCTLLRMEAETNGINTIEGQDLTDFTWEIEGSGVTITCDVSGSDDPDVTCTQTTLTWDTTNVSLGPEIFFDGFETGNVSGWSASVGGGGPGVKSFGFQKGGGATFVVTLDVGNQHVASFTRDAPFDLIALGTLAFNGDGFTIPGTPPDDGLYTFVATADNATEFRWEFEQEAGQPGDAGCRIITDAPCEILTTQAPTVDYQWPEGNIDGSDYRVGLEISNCDTSQTPLSTTRTVQNVTVGSSEPPMINQFRVVETNGCDCVAVGGGGCSCPVGVAAQFTLDIGGDCNDVSIDWGDGNTSTGLSCTQATYQHTYNATGTYTLEAEACFGVACDTQVNLTNFSTPVPLNIE